jgi:hypothetical protein
MTVNLNAPHTEVGEQRFVNIPPLVEGNGDLINDLQTTAFSDDGFDLLRLIWTHVVLGQDAFYRLQTLLDDFLIVGSAVCAQEVLQHVHGHIGAFLDQLGQVFAYHSPGKMLIQQVVKARIDGRCLRNHL